MGAMADQMKPAYLIHGTDTAKIDQARSRLRRRAEAEGGTPALESFEPPDGRGSPDADGLAAAIGSMSLMPGRRYLLADGIERWGKRQVATVVEAMESAPPETTVVLISRGKAPAGLAAAVEKVGGDLLGYDAPKAAQLVGHLVAGAEARGFELDPDAARMLIARLGDGLTRLSTELDRLAIWAGPGGRVEPEDLAEMVADATEVGGFALGDALVAGDRARTLGVAERLLAQGATAGSTVYPTATGVRRAHKALTLIESGVPAGQVERQLGLPPFLARRLVNSLSGVSVEDMRRAAIALSDLEVWTRGGAEYPDELALDLALLAAT